MIAGTRASSLNGAARAAAGGWNFGYLDEGTKRSIRRSLLKAVAIPGHQIPFRSREMPMSYGWGTGGIQLTSSLVGLDDTLKVIDQGADDTTNAVNIRTFFAKTCGIATTTRTVEASIIQTRHRIPETPLREGQILVYQVPMPEPLRRLEPSEAQTRKMHALEEYGAMYLRLYEDIAAYGRIATAYDYPVLVHGRYVMSPSPIPRFDNPKLDRNPALQLFGAGREKRLYAVPPYTRVESLCFDDYPFVRETWERACEFCASRASYLDEVVVGDRGDRIWICSDTDFCAQVRARA
jgi:alpha-D-ribose 1-methylphosphonate 5-phosphate C-P lyase